MGLLVWVLSLLFFPETSQPGARGVDELRLKEGVHWRERFVFVNPLLPLALLRSPNLFLVAIITFTTSLSVFVLLVPLVYTIGVRYSIKNEAILGLCFLPSGLGCIAGAQIIGRVSDRTVIKWRRRRNGVWYLEDRLRAALIPFGVVTPLAVLGFGIANQFIDGNVGLALCLFGLFMAGAGIEMCFGPCAANLVDVMHTRSAESLGANNGLRTGLVAFGISGVVPIMDAYGVAWTNAASAALIWIAFGILICVIRYGEQMRAWVEVGFSTADNH
ncbi:hypothetical protein D9619_012112 [Psilocybe cf. subviscida]|uniref:Major facilitator superfamily (MFS) profile domain-containing protein n=1 Tax=Psilocybe cf. subviscida TaxID=2480587 RepID=A0A8H5EZF4_9AGAR|nr:hypothetical protein D9619_012112 [Psilocybe cf. subviscida]